MKKTIALLSLAVGALLAIIVWRPAAPSPAAIQGALSTNALAYFRRGIVAGVVVERSRPGLPTAQLVSTALSYYTGLGPDPYLKVAPSVRSEQDLARLKAPSAKPLAQQTNAAPAEAPTNTVEGAPPTNPATNPPPSTPTPP